MRKLDPQATVEIEVGGAKFTYSVLTCRTWMLKAEATEAVSKIESGTHYIKALADATCIGLTAVDEFEPNADGLLDNLSIPELRDLADKSLNACIISPADKKKSDSQPSDTTEPSASTA